VLTNLPMRAAVDEAVRRVREGGALAPRSGRRSSSRQSSFHPMIASGEATGRLDTMLARAPSAVARARELDARPTALLGPLLIVAMGG